MFCKMPTGAVVDRFSDLFIRPSFRGIPTLHTKYRFHVKIDKSNRILTVTEFEISYARDWKQINC